MAAKVTIAAKSLQAVRQAAKELHTRNATAYIAKGAMVFELSGDGKKRIIKLNAIGKEMNNE